MAPTFSFRGELFEADAEAAWVFAAVPPHQASEIRDLVPPAPGFGSVRVAVEIGKSTWTTSLFPSRELNSYLLPVKRSVRDAERIDTGDVVDVKIRLIGLMPNG